MSACLIYIGPTPTATQLGFLVPSWTRTLSSPSEDAQCEGCRKVILIHINIFTNMLGDEPKMPIRLMICTTSLGSGSHLDGLIFIDAVNYYF